jgi:hypothetical protein
MTAVMTIVQALRVGFEAARRLPEWVWGVVVFAMLAGATWWLHTRSVELAVLADRQTQRLEAQLMLDSIVGMERAKARWAVEQAEAATRAAWASRDSAVQRTRQAERAVVATTARVRRAIAAVGDTLRKIPEVGTVVGACTALANDCEQLRARLEVERAATDTAKAIAGRVVAARERERATADTALTTATTLLTAERKQNASLRSRISRKAAVAVGAVAAGAGYGLRLLIERRYP